MKIILMTPGTGSYHCGVCMRDNALAKELIRQGHDAALLPMYLPLTLDEAPSAAGLPVFYGGVNVYLQQKFSLFRRAPRWLDVLFNHPWLLRQAAKRSGMTGGPTIGALTYSMLLGEDGHQAIELEKLLEWLLQHGAPDAIWLSTALLAGLARRLGQALSIPVMGSLQGEDSFLDGLAEPWRSRCWEALSERAGDVDRWIAPSHFFAGLMGRRMKLSPERVRVIPNGITLDGMEPRKEFPRTPVIGYLARMIEAKGLGLVVDAFIVLKKQGRYPLARLLCMGAMTAGDAVYVAALQAKLALAGFASDAEFIPNVTREEKIEGLKRMTLLSVPATSSEAFGLYLIEAMALGVPVVQPRISAFPEIVEATEGGLLYDPANAQSLAASWEGLLADPAKSRELGRKGAAAAHRDYSISRMAEAFVAETLVLQQERATRQKL